MGRILLSVLMATGLIVSLTAQSSMADSWSIFGRHNERGSGDVATEERAVGAFERIRLVGVADVRITIGDSCHVKVSTDDNLLDNIVTEITGRRTLVIDNEGSFSTSRGVQVEITMPTLSLVEADGSGDVEIVGLKSESLEIELGGSGTVDFDGEVKQLDISIGGSGGVTSHDLKAEDVRIETNGSGDVELRGSARNLECAVHGSGDIEASHLQTERAGAQVYGSGDISVYATIAFDGAIYGSGDIDLFGNPDEIDRHVAGSGDIRRRR